VDFSIRRLATLLEQTTLCIARQWIYYAIQRCQTLASAGWFDHVFVRHGVLEGGEVFLCLTDNEQGHVFSKCTREPGDYRGRGFNDVDSAERDKGTKGILARVSRYGPV
jgi:hypothetical protein